MTLPTIEASIMSPSFHAIPFADQLLSNEVQPLTGPVPPDDLGIAFIGIEHAGRTPRSLLQDFGFMLWRRQSTLNTWNTLLVWLRPKTDHLAVLVQSSAEGRGPPSGRHNPRPRH